MKQLLSVLLPLLFIISCTTNRELKNGINTNTIDTTAIKKQLDNIRSLSNDVFKPDSFTGTNHIEIKYRLFTSQSTTNKIPLVIVFHGSGAIGNDNNWQLGVLAKFFATPSAQDAYPAYVLAPQFASRSSDYVMDNKRNVLTSAPNDCLFTLLELVDSLIKDPRIDRKRIYVAGFSMGGSTVTNALHARPGLFAAGISIAGIPQFSDEKQHTPLLLIHGTADTENPMASDEKYYSEQRHNVTFWKLAGVEHNNIFMSGILNNDLLKWLYQHRKQ